MLKATITTLVLSLTVSSAFAMESSANVSQSTSSEEVEMEMTSEKQIVIRSAQPDAALYIVSEGKAEFLTPALVKAMAAVQSPKEAKQASGLELAIKILNTK